eukprot:TRINITY_DN32744_c0_g1_i1.p1 TRINITY_DN32744_c0_g1~~TRINITY_DN32744_c0_g1_i1.p1  ORF type:complete len:181 (+),score=19.26 TRINITY_DN32744_c0_g1_i1:3-545(+)
MAASASSLRSRAQTSRPDSQKQLLTLQYREMTPEDYELLLLLDEGLPKPDGKVASKTEVHDLPLVPLLSKDHACQICLSEIAYGSKVPQLPCGHSFHFECASRWFTTCSARCPICQGSIRDSPTASNSKDVCAKKPLGSDGEGGDTLLVHNSRCRPSLRCTAAAGEPNDVMLPGSPSSLD